MAEIIKENIVPVNPELKLPTSGSDGRGGRGENPQLFDEDNPPIGGEPFDPPGRGDRGDNSDNESTEPPLEDNASQDGVNGTEDKPSTDLSAIFGSYASVISSILEQLSEYFGQSAQDGIFDISDASEYVSYGDNVFQNFVATIDDISRKLSGTRETNVVNAYSTMMTYYMQILSAQMENQFNIQQWQVENEYNSPSQQLKRLSDAGLNPLYAFGTDWSNTASSLKSASMGNAPSMTAAQGDPNKFEKAMGIIGQVLGTTGQVAGAVQGGIGLAQSAQSLDINQTELGLKEQLTAADVGVKKSQQAVNTATAQNLAQTHAYNQEMFPMQLRSAYEGLQIQKQQQGLNEQQLKNMQSQEAQVYQGMALAAGDFLRNNKLADANIAQISSNITKNKAEMQHLFAQSRYIHSQADYQEFTNKFAKTTGIPFNSPLCDVLAVQAANGTINLSDFANGFSMIAELSSAKGNTSMFGLIDKSLGQAGNLVRRTEPLFNLLGSAIAFPHETFNMFKNDWRQMDAQFRRMMDGFGVGGQNAVHGATSSW